MLLTGQAMATMARQPKLVFQAREEGRHLESGVPRSSRLERADMAGPDRQAAPCGR